MFIKKLQESTMLKRTFITSLLAVTAVIATSIATPAQDKRTGHAEVNGIKYYYEITGKGEPLLLLHGGLGSLDMFGPVRDMLSAQRQVIAVDLHGHGRTALGTREFDPVAQGDDMASLLDAVGIKQADVLGYSMGGFVALQFGAQHPDRIRRLVIVSAPFAQDGFYPEMLPMQAAVSGGLADSMKGTPMHETYMAVAPVKEDFPRLLDQVGAFMRTPYNWSEDVKKLTMPVMLVYGDSDMVRLDHVVKYYQLLGGGLKDAGWQREHMSKNRLAILPNVTHYETVVAPQLATTVLPFLNSQDGAPARLWEQ
jgi:pimeloyl-ACP methyl ester carboxylesterase